MSIGTSGRIVIEVEPDVKRRLYALLASQGMSLKEWFLKSAEAYIGDRIQVLLPFDDVATNEPPLATEDDDLRSRER